jgi:ABC-type amino acid transport substrate-binding protein
VLAQPLAKDPLHLGFAKNMRKQDVIKRFDDAIDKMKRSGELQKLIADTAK